MRNIQYIKNILKLFCPPIITNLFKVKTYNYTEKFTSYKEAQKFSKISPIIIDDDVWLATRVIVLKGVTNGIGSVVSAGSVVTKSIPPNSFAAGVPAKVIRPI